MAMLTGLCPICDGEIQLDSDTMLGEIVECGDCGSELEVTGLNPLQLEEAPQEEEDWGE
ncbi:MAG: lysine biosynthesis protein LysW [Calditrichaeota bacterium]|nr:lysine biosynthesis protein LysW [Calditrichota bacterium]